MRRSSPDSQAQDSNFIEAELGHGDGDDDALSRFHCSTIEMTFNVLFNKDGTLLAGILEVGIFPDFGLGVSKDEKAFVVDPKEAFGGEVDGHAIEDRVVDKCPHGVLVLFLFGVPAEVAHSVEGIFYLIFL